MRYTESYFGLVKTSRGISANNGETILPKYADFEPGDFNLLITDIENYLEKELTFYEIENLKDLLK